ncbi:MAG: hypothetical protein IJP13_08080 [Lachnospiraceae bacterium]|nr:hypothetical protein [Lachnospiraceae bacterium]
MNSINIPSSDIKKLMNCLLVKETFDNFLLEEATITTYNTFTIDGHIHSDFYTTDELEALTDRALSTWRMIKPHCFNLIKGSKLPLRFKIVLKASASYTEKLLSDNPCGLALKDVGGLYINIRYDSKHGMSGEEVTTATLDCISMASLNIFSMDKTLEKTWDGVCEKFINELIS